MSMVESDGSFGMVNMMIACWLMNIVTMTSSTGPCSPAVAAFMEVALSSMRIPPHNLVVVVDGEGR